MVSEITPDLDDLLERPTREVATEFVGVFSLETVKACVQDSYRQLFNAATVTSYLPLLAERFARQRLRAAARTDAGEGRGRPSVLFVCAHNAGRSQIAAAWLRHLLVDVDAWSAGTDPAAELNPAVVEVMGEVGIDMAESFPKPLTDDVIGAADVVVTMGCGDACPVLPGRRYADWVLDHPVGTTVATARAARDELRERVEDLIATLQVGTA